MIDSGLLRLVKARRVLEFVYSVVGLVYTWSVDALSVYFTCQEYNNPVGWRCGLAS